MENEQFMREAITLSEESVACGGGPFGAVIVRDGVVVAKASNTVTKSNDPTAHAEINAIREACRILERFKLDGCDLYTSCEPCPMCLGAAYWAGVNHIYFANTRENAKSIDFDDSFIYDQIPLAPNKRAIPTSQMLQNEALKAFRMWTSKVDKRTY